MNHNSVNSFFIQPAEPTCVSNVEEAPGESLDDCLGCGWFDSSFDLKRGLEVRELTWSGLFPAVFAVA